MRLKILNENDSLKVFQVWNEGKYSILPESDTRFFINNSGVNPTITLPNSKIICDIPIVHYEMGVVSNYLPDRGIIPDYPFTPTIDDVIE